MDKMKKLENIAGILGGILLAFPTIWYTISKLWGPMQWAMLALGTLSLGYFFYHYFTKRQKELSTRSFKQGSNIAAQIIIVISIFAMLAFISTRQNIRTDLTENSLYSLSDQTEKILDSLDVNVSIKAFYKTSEQNAAKDILDEYTYRSDHISIEFVDPDEQPQIAKRYNVEKYNQILVSTGSKRELIDNLSESNLTNAIIKVTREQDKAIYFLSGHGEGSIADGSPNGYRRIAEMIQKENHIVRELNLAMRKSIPDSCTVLAIISPKVSLFPAELEVIKTFVENGGKVMLFTDPGFPAELIEFAAQFGLDLKDDHVVDGSGMGQLLGGGPLSPLANIYHDSHIITKTFNIMTTFHIANSVWKGTEQNGYEVSELVKTSEQSFAIKNLDLNANEIRITENDKQGPITIGVIAEKKNGNQKSSLMLFTDSDFIANGRVVSQGNANLFLNSVNYLADEADMISIRPKDVDDRRLTLTQADVASLFYLVVIVIPLFVIILGVVIFIRRNRS
jgi:ABC-type uncharacterized transport system involved in gliding motility auxiliary subunit